jgi:hypothetical protein
MSKGILPKSQKPDAAPARQQETPCYDRLVAELAALECVLGTLQANSLSDGQTGSVASAELVLRDSLNRLTTRAGDVLTMQERVVTVRKSRTNREEVSHV